MTIDIYLGINFENFQKFISCASYSKIMKLDQRDFNEVVEIGYVTCIIYTEINFSSPCNFIKENFSNKEESTYTMVVKNICTSSYFSSKHSFLFFSSRFVIISCRTREARHVFLNKSKFI